MKTELHRSEALWLLLANDTKLSSYVTDADIAQFKRRIRAEGLDFVTKTLPALGKALDSSFQTGVFECPEGWNRAKGRVWPAFLSTAFQEIYREDGSPNWVVPGTEEEIPLGYLDRSVGLAVHCIRQLTYVFYKYEQPWTDDQARDAYATFIKTEDELWDCTKSLFEGGMDALIDGIPLRTYLDRAEMLIARLLRGRSPKDISPCYGTGATAEKSTPWGRWDKPRFIPKLDAVYSVSEWFFSGVNGLDAAMRNSKLDLVECVDPTARFVLVPKDSRGPRAISAEPREFMFIQQGVQKALVEESEQYPNVKAQVSIIDQSRNRWLAMWASMTGSHASLDLKEASDRVSWWLVTRLFPERWVEAFESCRSESTIMPDGVYIDKFLGVNIPMEHEVPFTKFAPMGSACCFPVEALVFWALANAASPNWSVHRYNRMFSRSKRTREVAAVRGLTNLTSPYGELADVSVFGDDIIVPTANAERTIALLEAVGLKVNRHKSYTKGPFRESCGGDYYLGYDVAPVRVKRRLDGDSVECMLRVKDVFNRISLIYGNSSPSLPEKLRNLYQEYFGFYIPTVPVKHTDGTPGLVLLDYHWMNHWDGQTLKPKKDKRSRKTTYCITNVRRRIENPNKLQNNYGYSEYRVLTEVADNATLKPNWSSVLRSFCVGNRTKDRGEADIYALRKRVAYKYAWLGI